MSEFASIEINAIGSLIGIAFFNEIFNDSDVFLDIICGTSDFVWFNEIKRVEIFKESFGVKIGNFPNGFIFTFGAFF